jgi:hypothetical protein
VKIHIIFPTSIDAFHNSSVDVWYYMFVFLIVLDPSFFEKRENLSSVRVVSEGSNSFRLVVFTFLVFDKIIASLVIVSFYFR